MNTNELKQGSNRRNFFGTIARGATAIGLTSMAATLNAFAGSIESRPAVEGDPEEMFKKINGKHRVVFDVPRPNHIFPFAWPRVFLLTNGATGTPEKDCSVVVVLRHDAIPYAFDDWVWEKYHFGDVFGANDPATNKPALHNPFWKPKPGAFVIPGFGEVAIGINQLQESGVMFCVCDAAMTKSAAQLAPKLNMDAAEIKKDWMKGLIPEIQPVPSGVWALGRAHEKNCAPIFAG